MMDGADLGHEKALALAERLTQETGKKHYVYDCHYTGLVGGYDWWEVREYSWFIFYRVVGSFWAPDGEVRS